MLLEWPSSFCDSGAAEELKKPFAVSSTKPSKVQRTMSKGNISLAGRNPSFVSMREGPHHPPREIHRRMSETWRGAEGAEDEKVSRKKKKQESTK